MRTISDFAREQYSFVQEARSVLLDYCRTLRTQDFIVENNLFGRGGSIRNLLVHIANCYQFWILDIAFQESFSGLKYESFSCMADIEKLFRGVDTLMETYLKSVNDWGKEITYDQVNGLKKSTSAFKLFSHVITHEFHHKGQILSISRHLGYTPVDTDIMR